ncbi:MAG: CAP domain-containing protein [Actinomycetota bacterium]
MSGGKTRVWRVLAALVGAVVFFASSPFPRANALTSDEGALLSYTNAARAQYGKSKLSVASDLTAVARQHSKEMAAKGAIFHNSSLPSDVSGWKKIGENVGRGPSAKAVHQAFMSSSSHRTHILDGSYDQIGIGAVWSSSGSSKILYITEIFVDRAGGGGGGGSVSPPKKVVTKFAPARKPPKRKPKPVPPPAAPVPVSMGMLLQLIAMDAVPAEPAVDKPSLR